MNPARRQNGDVGMRFAQRRHDLRQGFRRDFVELHYVCASLGRAIGFVQIRRLGHGFAVTTGKYDDSEFEVLLYEFKADLNRYLQESKAPYRSLAELIAFNEANADRVMPHFGQDIFLKAAGIIVFGNFKKINEVMWYCFKFFG